MSQRWVVNNKYQAKQFCQYIMEHQNSGKVYEILEPKLTSQQMKAIHAYCDDIAKVLAASGHDMQQVVTLPIEPTGTLVKEIMWRPVQTALFNKKSVTQLKMHDVDDVFRVIAKHLAETHDIDVRFGRG